MRRRKPAGPERTEHSRRSIVGLIAFQLGVSIYGGYFGAGMGILMLASLAMMGIGDINRMNAVKTVLTVGINGVSVVIFVLGGDVLWEYALPMAAASILGGYLGAKLALRVHPQPSADLCDPDRLHAGRLLLLQEAQRDSRRVESSRAGRRTY